MPANLNEPFKVKRESLAWAAGIFEGEGTFSTRSGKNGGKQDRGLVAKLKMSDEDVIKRFHSIVKVGNVTGPYKCDGAGTKELWVWQTGSFEGVQFTMSALWSWLCSRRRLKITQLLNRFHEIPPKQKAIIRDPKTGRLLSGRFESYVR